MSVQKRVMTLIMLSIAALFLTGGLFAYNTGDYRTKWGGNWNDPYLWECYDGSGWISTGTPAPAQIEQTVYIRHYISATTNLNVFGRMEISGQLHMNNSTSLIVHAGAELVLGTLRLPYGSELINNGLIQGLGTGSSLTTEFGSSFVNNAQMQNNTGFLLNQLSGSRLSFGPQGTVSGDGSFNAGWGAILKTANPGGVDSSLNLSGNKTFDKIYFEFTGDQAQITGSTMPPSALGIVFSNPAGTALSQDINIVNEVLVTPGSTLSFGFSELKRDYYGAGVFTMTAGSTIYTAHPQGISSSTDQGSVQLTIRNFNSSANYGFNGQEPQEVDDFETQPAFDPEGRVVVGNLIVENEAGVNFSNPILVEGTVVVNTGTATGDVQIDGDESFVDGINSSYYYHSFEANGNPIRNYRPQTDNGNQQQSQVRRRWRITGQMMGSKRVTFYWDAADDAHLDWSGSRPVVVKGNTTLTTLAYDLASEPRWITVQVSELEGRANFAIGIESDDTLPVELSAFDMVLTPGNKVRLRWISQSETALTGYLIYRSTTEILQDAILISSLIEPTNSSQTSYYNFDDGTVQPGTTYYYWLQSLDLDGGNQYHGPIRADLPYFDSPSTPGTLQTGLNRAYPNPFNPDLTISYSLERSSDVKLDVYNLRGQVISRLVQGSKSAGTHNYVWNGTDSRGQSLPSGSYLLVLEADEHRSVSKVTLLK